MDKQDSSPIANLECPFGTVIVQLNDGDSRGPLRISIPTPRKMECLSSPEKIASFSQDLGRMVTDALMVRYSAEKGVPLGDVLKEAKASA